MTHGVSMKRGLAAVTVLLLVAATPAFAERPPNQVLPGDIEEYQRVCAAERQSYGQEIEPSVLARGVASPGWAELADHWHSQYPGNGMVERYWTNNTLSASQLEASASQLTPGWERLPACAIRVRAAQLRRLPQAEARQTPATRTPTANAGNSETNTSRREPAARRGRGDPPQLQARVVRQAGETQCMNVRALPTRWYSPLVETDTRVLTPVEILNNCGRRQLVEVLASPYPMELGRDQFRNPMIQGMGGWYGWPNASMRDPAPPLSFQRYAVAYNTASGILHQAGAIFEILQEQNEARTIEVQLASCDATREGSGGREVKVMFLESDAGTNGFLRVECPVVPDTSFTQQDRENLARIFNIPRPPANEHPQMTRCMNRDGALDLLSAEASCRNVANDASTPESLRGYALYDLARIRLIARDYPAAIEIGNQALALRPSANAHLNLALAYMGQQDYAAAIGHLNAAHQLDDDNLAVTAALRRATLLQNNPGWLRQEEEQRVRQALQASGLMLIESTRSSCVNEAAALDIATDGKGAVPNSGKLDRFIATSAEPSQRTLREGVEALGALDELPEVARAYISCLVEANARQVERAAQVAAETARRQPAFVGRYVMSIDYYGTENDVYQSSLEIRANGTWRMGRHWATGDLVRGGLALRDSASGPWRTEPSGQIDLDAPVWPVPYGVSLALVYDGSGHLTGCVWTAGESCGRVTAQRQ